MLKLEVSLRVGGGGFVGRSRRRGWLALVFAVPAGLSASWALALAGSAAALPSNCTQSAATVTCTFSSAGSEGTFAVPAGVSSVHVVANGGGGQKNGQGHIGGTGAQVTSDLNVTAGSNLFVEVGIGGGGGGSQGAGAGGGESDVRTCSITDSSCPAVGSAQDPRLVVGGGGGGAGAGGGGGAGGPAGIGTQMCNPGNDGEAGFTGVPGAGGKAGGCTSGGVGGPGAVGGMSGGSGTASSGGAGANFGNGGGGGGAGYFGGGGGGSNGTAAGSGGGGGGGSSFGPTPSAFTIATTGPSVVISYTAASPPSASISTPANGATYAQRQVVSSNFSCAEGAGGPGITSCLDQNGHSSGTAVDTYTPGQHTFTVTATSKDGLTGQSGLTYTVAAAPSVSIASPVDGASYEAGQVVNAAYGCGEGAGGPGLASCAGTVPAGTPIDTSTPGRHSFTVIATSTDGQHTARTVSYKVVLPDNRFAIRDVRSGPGGTVRFKLTLPAPGVADVLETAWLDNFARTAALLQPAPGRFVFARKHLTISGRGTITVTVTPNRRGERLIAHHRYAVVIRLWISYIPTNGTQRNIGLYRLHLTHPTHHRHSP